MLENKLRITNEIEFEKEERIIKIKSSELFDINKINEFAGKIRDVNLAEGNFGFAPCHLFKRSPK